MQWARSLAALFALALALFTWADDADAGLQGMSGHGAGAPAISASPPIAASKLFRVAAVDHPMAGQPPNPGSLGGLFNRRGLMGGFAAGFLGAGPLGLLFGRGLTDELGSVASYIGLLVQLALIAMLAWLIWSWWTGRNQPAFSGLSPRELADPYLRTRHEMSPEFDSSADGDGGSGADDEHPQTAKPAVGGGLKR
jgi:predicted lipid-binding transport protein (Tim44 family)